MHCNVLLIDNYDSFVYNLSRYCNELGAKTSVRRNDDIELADILKLRVTHIILSPGPCTPNEAGLSLDIVRSLFCQLPILGVCLGHQVIAQVFGGKVIRALAPKHGKCEAIQHTGVGIFGGLPNPLTVTRYHSLVVESCTLPSELEAVAWSKDQELMAIRHRDAPLWGVQFHPEAILTQAGQQLVHQFLALKKAH